jgi:DNA modification methylase
MKSLKLNVKAYKKTGFKRTRGPPNRMNDLSYTEWMRFQKSFFRHKSFPDLIEECIYFFTKAVWDNGRPSNSLVVGFPKFSVSMVFSPRKIFKVDTQFPECLEKLELLSREGRKFDFIMVNLFDKVDLQTDTYSKSKEELNRLFSSLKLLLKSEKYCGLVSNSPNSSAVSFPIPWSISYHGRGFLRLRDEKIGLIGNERTRTRRKHYHIIFFQNIPPKRPPKDFSPQEIVMTKHRSYIPSWIIPKPPPRKKGELLHPAKFPETLVEEFIEMFTRKGDSVFDPMVGTGSTILAATRLGRNAFGIDLSEKYVKIAKDRLREEFPVTLFKEDMTDRPRYEIICGDATKLDEITILKDMKFHYCITSPPYWSMLRSPGSEYQRSRKRKSLPLFYSDDPRDLGNIRDYDEFLKKLTKVYEIVAGKLVDSGFLTVIVKNVKRNHIIYPLAWDIVSELCRQGGFYNFIGNTFWCQDDIPMKPFAVGIHWVSNTVHQYCLHFQKRKTRAKE